METTKNKLMQPTKAQLLVENLKMKKEIKKMKANHLKVCKEIQKRLESVSLSESWNLSRVKSYEKQLIDLKKSINLEAIKSENFNQKYNLLLRDRDQYYDLWQHELSLKNQPFWKIIYNRLFGKYF